MNKKAQKRIKKLAKKVRKEVIKQAKKEPRKFAITVLIIILVLAIVLGCLYFFGPLKDWLPNNGSGSSEPTTSEPNISDSNNDEFEIESVMESYKEDSLDTLNPDNGGLSSNDVDKIRNAIRTYYATVDNTYRGETLWSTLKETTKPTALVTYGELRYASKGNPKADASPADPTKMIDFYTGIHYPSEWKNGNTWQREHVWCTSHSWWSKPDNSDKHAGTDLHHLRPEIGVINGSRSNSKFGEVKDRESKVKKYNYEGQDYIYGYIDGQVINEGVFEPTDRVKGDVARIIMYLLVRYKGETTPVTNIIYTSEKTPDSAYELLLKWHKEDPVSNFEIKRNQVTYEIQGNRNPFIDCPNYAQAIWGEN